MNFDTSSNAAGMFWITLCLVNAGLAETKGRSRLQWFLLSLFIGPLATALLVVWPRSTAPVPEPLHPIAKVTDRYLLAATIAMVLFVIAIVISISVGIAGATAWVVAAWIFVAAASALTFVLSIRGYNRHVGRTRPTVESPS